MTNSSQDTEKLYDDAAASWQRREPSSLSDFTGRPAVFELCGDVQGYDIIDLGCGEGYCARELMQRGAGSIFGVELSHAMVELACEQEQELNQGIHYEQGDVTQLRAESESFDLALGVFVFNYTSIAQTQAAFAEAWRVLRPGGHFVFSVPHPAFGWIRTVNERPFYFDVEGRGYFSCRDHQTQGEIFRRNGTALPVQMVHKTVADYFDALKFAGFTALPEVKELKVLPEHLELDPDFFSPVTDTPLHMAIRIVK